MKQLCMIMGFGMVATLAACTGPVYEKNELQLTERWDGKLEAHAPADCPKWKDPQLANYSNSVMANYGCAHAKNLSLMVDDPADFLGSYDTAGPDADRTIGVVQRYKSGEAAASGSNSAEE